LQRQTGTRRPVLIAPRPSTFSARYSPRTAFASRRQGCHHVEFGRPQSVPKRSGTSRLLVARRARTGRSEVIPIAWPAFCPALIMRQILRAARGLVVLSVQVGATQGLRTQSLRRVGKPSCAGGRVDQGPDRFSSVRTTRLSGALAVNLVAAAARASKTVGPRVSPLQGSQRWAEQRA
jgi:hypothetical protein